MKSFIHHYPTGVEYLELVGKANWHSFPDLAGRLLRGVGAYDVESITRGGVVDAHWYEFSWQGGRYRLVFEEWPPQCSIEKLRNVASLEPLRLAIQSADE